MRKRFVVILVVLLLSVFLVSAAEYLVGAASSGDDWPMFRHDAAHSGYSTSSVLADSDLLWTFPNPKITNINLETENAVFVTSSPAVADGRLYIGQVNGGGFYCLNASTGTKIWSVTNVSPSTQSSPAVYGGVVYMPASDLNLMIAFNASTGEQIWNANKTTGNGAGSSPVVGDGVVYTCSYDAVYALDALTGTQIWAYPLQGPLQIPVAVDYGLVYGYDGGERIQGYVFALNASTGRKVWNYTIGPSGQSSSPAVADGKVYIGSVDGGVFALEASTGNLIWNYTTGREVWGAPAIAYGIAYVGSGDKNMYAFNASTGDKIWNYTLGGGIHASPAIADGVVYVSSDDRYLYALNASTGTLMWKYLTISPSDINATYNDMFSSPIVANGCVYIATTEGNVLAFGNNLNVAYSHAPLPTVPELTLPAILLLMVTILVTIYLLKSYKGTIKGHCVFI